MTSNNVQAYVSVTVSCQQLKEIWNYIAWALNWQKALTVTLFELLVTHLECERFLRTGFAIAKPDVAIATLALHNDDVNDC